MSSFEPLWGGVPAGGFAPLAAEEDAAAKAWRRLVPGADPGAAADASADAADAPPDPALVAAEEAYARGVADARAEAAETLRQHQEAIAAALAEIERFRTSLRERWHDQILDLVLEVARRVVRRELDARPEQWLELVRAGVHKALDRERILVRVGPALHAFLAERRDELHAGLEDVKELELVEDPGVPPSGCVLETSMGDIELGIDSQIEAIRTELEELA